MLGIQHVLAMFGATVLAPLLMGFDANLAIMMSGICTILFFIMTGGRVPSIWVQVLPLLRGVSGNVTPQDRAN